MSEGFPGNNEPTEEMWPIAEPPAQDVYAQVEEPKGKVNESPAISKTDNRLKG